ncbi:MAG: TetR/AcrR family transcriptional regulator [Deltaproteobacteria bacterium]|nr:TetR/AcrR family transcriptional regulator [Deltaproteobacteria bacterium]
MTKPGHKKESPEKAARMSKAKAKAKARAKPQALGRSDSLKRRPAGRVPLDQRVDTREIICKKCILVIADKGIQGTTVKEVAQRAGLTPAMVHYHFKNRDYLINATLTRFLKPIADSVWEAVELDIGPLEMLREFHQRLREVFTTVPWYSNFWSRELASASGRGKEIMGSLVNAERLRVFREKILLGQKQGIVNPDLIPDLVFPSLLSLAHLPRIWHNDWKNVWLSELTDEEVNRHVWGTILNGLAAKDTSKPL